MNIIKSHPVGELGYGFIEKKFIPRGKNEYYLREMQNQGEKKYRKLTTREIDILVNNRNTSDDWQKLLVSENFDANLIKNCKFYGLVRIGQLQPLYHEYHNLRLPVGIYNSTIISCDLGDNVCIDNVNYLSHYIIGNQVMLANINELATTDHAKFGNGILKEGEDEKVRVQIEVCNENGGRAIIPFDGMLAGDAYLWSKYRDDQALLDNLKILTEKKFDKRRGYYGTIGDRTIIKNCRIIKDARIGTDAYIKGANKLKNVTINSDSERPSQIGEGCELVNGIVGYGCRIFYGVKAVRFIVASHSQLKYGARLINSYMGNNSTISCCEVLNSLIFPAHEQHHNNSFLCASLLMGQSNIAAGATIGSNHNSRSADGEIQANRGFWPGLCVSLKHNSKFASFSILAKGDYPYELNIPVPFALVSQDIARDRLVVMPGYWFMYNMYAIERNSRKYKERDRRTFKYQHIEFDYLAPDTVNEIFESLKLLTKLKPDKQDQATVTGWENSARPVVILKVKKAIAVFNELVMLYAAEMLINHIIRNDIRDFKSLKKSLPAENKRTEWVNIGGQLILKKEVEKLKSRIRRGKINDWQEIHDFYAEQGRRYEKDRLHHSYASLLELMKLTHSRFSGKHFMELMEKMVKVREWMYEGIVNARAKDYSNPFRKMVYENDKEMDKVLGRLKDNSFLKEQEEEMKKLRSDVKNVMGRFHS